MCKHWRIPHKRNIKTFGLYSACRRIWGKMVRLKIWSIRKNKTNNFHIQRILKANCTEIFVCLCFCILIQIPKIFVCHCFCILIQIPKIFVCHCFCILIQIPKIFVCHCFCILIQIPKPISKKMFFMLLKGGTLSDFSSQNADV